MMLNIPLHFKFHIHIGKVVKRHNLNRTVNFPQVRSLLTAVLFVYLGVFLFTEF